MAGLISQVRKTGTLRPERSRGKHRGWRRRPVRARDLLLWFALADLLIIVACVVLGIAHG